MERVSGIFAASARAAGLSSSSACHVRPLAVICMRIRASPFSRTFSPDSVRAVSAGAGTGLSCAAQAEIVRERKKDRKSKMYFFMTAPFVQYNFLPLW